MAVNHRTVIRSDPNYRLHNTSDMKEQSSVPKQRDSQTLENRSPLAHELEDTKRKKEREHRRGKTCEFRIRKMYERRRQNSGKN